jgi:CBS domain-containing protein
MARVGELLQHKGAQVYTIGPEATVLQAALVMNEHRCGALVVLEGGCVIGIFSERDLLRRVVAERRDPAQTLVAEVMTAEVVCCSPETSTDEARGAMRHRRIRHLPVADGEGHLLGLVSIGDLNAELQAEQETTLFFLREYIGGRT